MKGKKCWAYLFIAKGATVAVLFQCLSFQHFVWITAPVIKDQMPSGFFLVFEPNPLSTQLTLDHCYWIARTNESFFHANHSHAMGFESQISIFAFISFDFWTSFPGQRTNPELRFDSRTLKPFRCFRSYDNESSEAKHKLDLSPCCKEGSCHYCCLRSCHSEDRSQACENGPNVLWDHACLSGVYRKAGIQSFAMTWRSKLKGFLQRRHFASSQKLWDPAWANFVPFVQMQSKKIEAWKSLSAEANRLFTHFHEPFDLFFVTNIKAVNCLHVIDQNVFWKISLRSTTEWTAQKPFTQSTHLLLLSFQRLLWGFCQPRKPELQSMRDKWSSWMLSSDLRNRRNWRQIQRLEWKSRKPEVQLELQRLCQEFQQSLPC